MEIGDCPILCAMCVEHLIHPNSHVRITGKTPTEPPGNSLVLECYRASLDGKFITINEVPSQIGAVTMIGGTATCTGHYHYALNGRHP